MFDFKKNIGGFTLIEIMVTLVVLSVVGTAVLRVTASNQQQLAQTMEQINASKLLKKAEYLLWKDGVAESTDKTEMFEDYELYSWQAVVNSTDTSNIYHLLISVFKTDDYEKKQVVSLEKFLWIEH